MSNTGSTITEDSPPQISRIVLRVDEKVFYTAKETLIAESSYFSALLSGRWPDPAEDGKYTLDMDAEVFTHILRYLRSGMLPVFYDDTKGFDHALYVLVLEQAEFLGIDRLRKWIQDKRYLQAVTKARSVKILLGEKIEQLDGLNAADTISEYHVLRAIERTYICPRGIFSHTQPENCGRQCRNAHAEESDRYCEEKVPCVVEIRTKTVFNNKVCLEGRG